MAGERTTISADDLARLLGSDEEVLGRMRKLALMVIEDAMDVMYSGTAIERAKVRTVMLPALLKLLAGDDTANSAESLRREMKELLTGQRQD